MPISKTRFPDGVGQATQVNPETADTGKPVNKFDGRKNMDAGTYELRAERDFGERIYRYWHRA